MSGPLRVVGVGSPHGDDAVAWEVIRRLRELLGELPGVEWATVDGGQRLLDLLDGRGMLILVDALAGDGTPGTIHRLDWPDPRLAGLRPGSTHDLKPAQALQLAGALGVLPPVVTIFGIEARAFGPQEELSRAVADAVPELVRWIAEQVTVR